MGLLLCQKLIDSISIKTVSERKTIQKSSTYEKNQNQYQSTSFLQPLKDEIQSPEKRNLNLYFFEN